MGEIDYLVKGDVIFEDTYNLQKIMGTHVLSKSGLLVGKVKEVRILPEKTAIEGILVKRGLFKKSVFISKAYFEEITQDALILNIDPTMMLKGRRVLSAEGEPLGIITSVIRKDNTNDIDKLIAKNSLLTKRIIIPSSAIKKIGESVFLNEDYHADKNISGKNLDKAVTSDDILGKEVLDSDGHTVGVAEKLYLDPNNFDVVGIGVDKGFLRTGLVIGKDYLEKVTPYAIFLNMRVALEVKGMNIYDKYGVLLGKVKEVALKEEKNVLNHISMIPAGNIAIKSFKVPASYISNIGFHVFLKISKADFNKLVKNLDS